MTIPRTALALFLLGLTCSAQSAKPDLAARLQRVEDQQEIQRVLVDYGRFLDARDFAGYSQLFAKDGEWVGGFGTVQGPAAIKAFMEKNMPGKGGGNYHILTNFAIDVHGDTATAWSRWMFVVTGPNLDPNGKAPQPTLRNEHPTPAQLGHYDDTFVRENGHWKFKRRQAPGDIPQPAAK